MTRLREIMREITRLGVHDFMDNTTSRYVVFTNTLAILTALILFLICAILLTSYGFSRPFRLIIVASTIPVFLAIPLLNHLRFYHTSRLLLCWFIPVLAVGISVVSKIVSPDRVSVNDYFDFRIVMLFGAIVPLLIFDSTERKLLIIGLMPGILLAIFFDPIHRLFGVSFSARYEDPTYFMTTALSVVTYVGILAFIGGLKRLSDHFEQKINLQNQLLSRKNEELTTINEVVEEQKKEIVDQNKLLKTANKTIEKQKEFLRQKNEELQEQVKEKTVSLSNANRELTLHNNELREFSHMLSHNLKAPVSSLKGLLHLVDRDQLGAENRNIFKHIDKTLRSMDNTFKDLGKIIEIRHDMYAVRDMIDIVSEVEHIQNLLQKDILKHNVKIVVHKNIEQPLFSNRIKIQSILFNLVHNAIKYRHQERKPEISITLDKLEDDYRIVIRDNGLGIDLDKHREKIFQLYARFHDHVDGKGMGLYLVRQQIESLGGSIEVESRCGEFTQFTISIPDSTNITEVG